MKKKRRANIAAVLKPGESVSEFLRMSQRVEISTIQCFERGEPLSLITRADGSLRKRNRVWTDEDTLVKSG